MTVMPRILLLDPVHPDFQFMLEKLGYQADFQPIESEEQLISLLPVYDGLVVRSIPRISRNVIGAGTALKFIARVGSGTECIDVDYAESKGIVVLNSPEGNCDAVGEHALGLLISLNKKISESSVQVRNGIWDRQENRGTELMGKTVAIIGYGNTGSAFARKLRGLDVKVMAYDKYKTGFSNEFVEECTLQNIFEFADVVSFHVPQTEETIDYADKEFFGSLKKPVVLINTSRGKVVNTAALVEAIQKNIVLAAGLDVVDWENWHFCPENIHKNSDAQFLLSHPSVIITPHIAGITHESLKRHAVVLSEKIGNLKF
jgi:D-3-phosphoglycerate dehydrogenase / 2-oxoglutarate reductase